MERLVNSDQWLQLCYLTKQPADAHILQILYTAGLSHTHTDYMQYVTVRLISTVVTTIGSSCINDGERHLFSVSPVDCRLSSTHKTKKGNPSHSLHQTSTNRTINLKTQNELVLNYTHKMDPDCLTALHDDTPALTPLHAM